MSSLNVHSLLLLAVCAQLVALGLAKLMYPYGPEHGDSTMPLGDDNTYTVNSLIQSFKYDGINRQDLQVRI